MDDTFTSALDTLTAELNARGGLCIAWSGGLDSTVLLDLARRARQSADGRDGGPQLAAVYVDHGLRSDSGAEAAACRRRGHTYGIPVLTPRLELPDAAGQGPARQARYAALAEAARRLGLHTIATAHHADDAVETALLRLSEGAGGAAMSSLAPGRAVADAPVSGWDDLRLVRPLLEVPKDRLESYARRRGLSWVVDPTNRRAGYTRNKIRHRVVPEMLELADSHRPLLRSLANLADESDAVDEIVGRLWTEARQPPPHRESIAFRRPPIASAPPAVRSALIRRALRELPRPGRASRPQLVAVRKAVPAADELPKTFAMKGATVTVDVDRVILEMARGRSTRERQTRRAVPIPVDWRTPPSGSVPWFHGRLAWRYLEPDDPTDFPRTTGRTWCDADRLPSELCLRGPRPGERFPALGLDGSKSVTDVLRAADVPTSERWRWPCLADAGGEPLVWVCGLRRADRALVDEQTDRVVEFEWRASR